MAVQTPRLPSPFNQPSWAIWAESLIRVLQFWIDQISRRVDECCGSGHSLPLSGSFVMDDGTATDDGVFMLDEGGA
jgi:hypothetical protein